MCFFIRLHFDYVFCFTFPKVFTCLDILLNLSFYFLFLADEVFDIVFSTCAITAYVETFNLVCDLIFHAEVLAGVYKCLAI